MGLARVPLRSEWGFRPWEGLSVEIMNVVHGTRAELGRLLWSITIPTQRGDRLMSLGMQT